MGDVFLAEEVKLGRRVAVKTILPATDDSAGRARFAREAQALANVEHPNVVRIYSFGEEEHVAYIVMELVQGESLADRIRRERELPVRDVIEIANQVVDALEAAANRGIVHRDVKPSNILLDEHGRVRVADFGLAKRVDGDAELTREGIVVGTPHYLAPEQVTGGPVDFRADIYALGLVMYEMLTGEKAFPANTAVAVVARQLHDALPAIRREIPPRLARLIARMTEKDPNARPQSYAEIRSECGASATALKAAARPPHSKWALLPLLLVFTHAAGPVHTAAQYRGAPINVDLRDADIRDFAKLVGHVGQVNVAVDPEVKASVSVDMRDVPWDQALDTVLQANGLIAQREANVIRVTTLDGLLHDEREIRSLYDAQREASGLPKRPPPPRAAFSGVPITIHHHGSDIREVCREFQRLTGLNIVVDADVAARVDIDLANVPWDLALDLILQQHDLTYILQGNVLRVTTRAKALAEAQKLIALRRTREYR